MYREWQPPPGLAPFVDRLFVASGGPAQRILPDGCMDVHVTARGVQVIGAMTRAVVVPASDQPIRAVRFVPGGAAAFLGIACDELTDRIVDWADLGIGAAPRDLERWLLARSGGGSPLVRHAVARLASAAPPSIAALADETGMSRQWLTRACRRAIGLPAKQLARVARMQRAIIALQRRVAPARVAAETGYFDQAHLGNELRTLAGITPREASDPVSIFPIRSLYAAP